MRRKANLSARGDLEAKTKKLTPREVGFFVLGDLLGIEPNPVLGANELSEQLH